MLLFLQFFVDMLQLDDLAIAPHDIADVAILYNALGVINAASVAL